MNRIESEEASNDTTIISELLNSAEAMQTSVVTSSNASTIKLPLQQKDEQQIFPNTDGLQGTFCDATKQNMMVSLQRNLGMVESDLLNSTQYSDMEDLNKLNIRHVHIPYILNGELYQIQTQDGENVTVKCCHCPPDRVYRGSVRSTGNFHMHIKRRHPDLLEKLHDMKVNALLERRDRLMRNRKITHRNNRNRSTNAILNSNDMCSVKNEEKSEMTTTTLDSTTESSLMHTHKLKIKTVFQRHQMQQRQAAEMQNWKNTEYVVMPIDKLSTDEGSEQPVNYSLKSRENQETLPVFSSNFSDARQQPQQQQQEKRKPHDTTAQTSFDNYTNLSSQATNLSYKNAAEENKLICNNHTNNRNVSTSSISISCPSVMSSYSGSHQYDLLESNRFYSSFSLQHHNLSVIKPEQMILGAEGEAIDLTMHTDSGIFSNSEDNNSENYNDSGINNIRAGTQELNTANVTTIDAEGSSERAKWQELLIQVESSLRDIQREMNVRNQIESNRMFLDIAKFKFLNPGFQFNW